MASEHTPSEQSLKKAREICAPSYSGGTRMDDAQHVLDVAAALDAAKAERTEEWDNKTFADLTNEEAGRWIKMFASRVEAWATGEWTDSAELTVALTSMLVCQAVRMAIDSNAGSIDFEAKNVTHGGISQGDWRIRIDSLSKGSSHEG